MKTRSGMRWNAKQWQLSRWIKSETLGSGIASQWQYLLEEREEKVKTEMRRYKKSWKHTTHGCNREIGRQ